LGTLLEQSKEKLEESQETVRDVAIAIAIHTCRDEFIVIGVRMNMCKDP